MKFSVDSLSLSEAVNKVIKAISVKKNNPVLECIKLSARDNYITLIATDMELSIEKKIVADVVIEGDILVPGKFFSEFIRTLNEETLTLECSNGTNLEVKYGESYGYIKCLNVEDYPNVGEVKDDFTINILNKDMKTLINKTVFCASSEDNRQVLKGCLLEVDEKMATMVALDGYRLALCKKELVGSSQSQFSAIIPARSLLEISKMLVNEDDELVLKLDGDKLRVEIDNTVIISRLIKGEFINYRNIINKDFTAVVTLSKNQFAEYIDRASLISRISKNNLVKIEVKEGFINVESNSEIGNLNESLPARVEGKENVICFNGKYLQDFLSVIDDEFIKMNIKASSAPCVFTQVDRDDYLFLVLPMRIAG